jgi:hypothetical protein
MKSPTAAPLVLENVTVTHSLDSPCNSPEAINSMNNITAVHSTYWNPKLRYNLVNQTKAETNCEVGIALTDPGSLVQNLTREIYRLKGTRFSLNNITDL